MGLNNLSNRTLIHNTVTQISQRDILNSIEREMSSDLRAGFKAVGT